MDNSYDLEGKGFVSVWIGNFSSQEEFDRYFAEKIGESDSAAAPMNNFAADIGFGFYDHDFQEADFNAQGSLPVEDILDGFFNSDFYLREAVKAAEKLNLKEANAAVVLVDYKYAGQTKSRAPIKFIGTFPYDQR